MKRERRRCLALILAVLIMITALPIVMPDLITEEVNAATTKHYPDKWSTYNFDSQGRSFDDTNNRNKGYYLAPKGSGKYPALMYVHGAGTVSNILNTNLISLIEYWTEQGYMDEMVVVVPQIDRQPKGTDEDKYDCFRRFVFNDNEGLKLVSEIVSGNRFDGKVNTKAPLHVTGYSMGGSVTLALGVRDNNHCYNLGAFSCSNSFYLGDGNYGWYNYASDIKYSGNTRLFLSYGKGEDAYFKENAERYKYIIEKYDPDVTIKYNAFDASYGGHDPKLFTVELFSYLYYNKFGTMPTDALIKSAMNPSSNPVTPTPTKKPTNTPTPTKKPTNTPTKKPTNTPTKKPTNTPTKKPTNTPTKTPTAAPTPLPPATMPDVIGMNYQDAQRTITDLLSKHGFDKVNYQIAWVDNNNPALTCTVRKQDPEAGKLLYGNHSTITVTLYVAERGITPTPSKPTNTPTHTPTPTKKPTNTPTKKTTNTPAPTKKPTIKGTVTKTGKPVVGQQLVVTVSNCNVAASNLNFAWQTGGTPNGYYGQIYEVKKEDVGKSISCIITDSTGNYAGQLKAVFSSATTPTPTKKPTNTPTKKPTPSNTPTAVPSPAKPANLTTELMSSTKVKVSWSAVADATGYEVYRSTEKDGTYSKTGAVTTTSRDCPGLTSWTTYYFKVRAYRTVSGKKIFGDFSAPVSAMPIGTAPRSVKAQVVSATKVKLTWAEQPGATGYEVFRSTSKDGTYTKLGAVTTPERECPGLTTGTRYYFKVRAYKVVNGENVYTDFCAPVSATPRAVTTSIQSATPTLAKKMLLVPERG